MLTSALGIFAKDFPEAVQPHFEQMRSFVVGWHKFFRSRFPAVTDHILYRLVSGVLLANPEELATPRELSAHLYYELESEYFCFTPETATSVDSLLDEFSSFLKAQLFDGVDGLVSVFRSEQVSTSTYIYTVLTLNVRIN